jgi:hypothetical protein
MEMGNPCLGSNSKDEAKGERNPVKMPQALALPWLQHGFVAFLAQGTGKHRDW